MDGNHIQPVVEVFPEPAAFNRFFQVFVGGTDHAHIDANGLLSANPFKLTFLQKAQKFGLNIIR